MLLLKHLILLLREHEIELAAPFTVVERVDEEIDVVDLFDLLDKLVHILQEVFGIDVVEEIYVELVLPQQLESFAVAHLLDESHDCLE